MTSDSKILIRARNLTVDFPTYVADRSLKRSIFKSATGGRISGDSEARIVVRALDGLNFEIKNGERIGLYGHNGSGKTTLLRVLTGAYPPTAGYIEVRGKVASLLDITMGLEGDATGWENIRLRGLMMGMLPEEIRNQTDEIAEFSGLGNFLDMPLRTYSSGMQIRLAFAVATAIRSDILILDEWLSVGDDEFQKKASMRLNDIINKASILVIASHSIELLSEICNKIYYISSGKIVNKQ
jgi:lipopolysaccharide transport system ATP-binding protein